MSLARTLAIAAISALVATPVIAAEEGEAVHDVVKAQELQSTQMRCNELMTQFDKHVGNVKVPASDLREAKALRKEGATQCRAEENLDVAKTGMQTLETALHKIGLAPRS